MALDEIVEIVLSDEKSLSIPALYIVQIVLILSNKGLLKEGE